MSAVSDARGDCPICSDESHARTAAGECWRLRPHPDRSPIAGWHIVDLARHAESWDALTAEESAELGPLLSRVTRAIREVTGCTRVYILAFCEAVPHLHLHLVPRHQDDPRSAAWSVADLYRQVRSSAAPPADPTQCAAMHRDILRRLQTS